MGIGETEPTSALHCSTSSFSASNNQYTFTGSHVGLNSNANKYSLSISPTLAPTYAGTLPIVVGEFIGLTVNPGTSCTITNAYGLYIGIGSGGGAGDITNGYGLYVSNPAFGTNQYTARFASGVGIDCAAQNNALSVVGSVGIGYGDTAAPTDGLLVKGQVGVGTDAPQGFLDVKSTDFTDGNILLYLNGTLIGGANTNLKSSLFLNTSIEPTYVGNTTCSGMTISPNFIARASCTITTAYGINISAGSGTRIGSGTITNGYGLYVSNPAYGKNQYTARLDAGVGIGTNPDASAALQVQSTTQGFLPPAMTTAQKIAITSPAAGLIVYDSSLKSIYFYNGTSWTTI